MLLPQSYSQGVQERDQDIRALKSAVLFAVQWVWMKKGLLMFIQEIRLLCFRYRQ